MVRTYGISVGDEMPHPKIIKNKGCKHVLYKKWTTKNLKTVIIKIMKFLEQDLVTSDQVDLNDGFTKTNGFSMVLFIQTP